MPHHLGLFPDDFSKCDFSEGIGERIKGVLPRLADRFSAFPSGSAPGFEELALGRFDDVEEGNFLRRTGQKVAAVLATPAFDEARVAKVGEDLCQVVGRNRLYLAQFLDTAHFTLAVGSGELGEHSGGVFDLGRELQKKKRGNLK
jgi:hypothetical protein